MGMIDRHIHRRLAYGQGCNHLLLRQADHRDRIIALIGDLGELGGLRLRELQTCGHSDKP